MTDEDEIFSILSSTRALAGKRNSRMRFRCHRKRIDRSRLHYRLDAFLTVHTKTFENHRIARCDARCVQRTAAWLAQLGEHRSAEREVVGSNPGRTNTQGL